MKITIPWLDKKKTASGRVAIAVGPDGWSIAHVDGQGRLDFCRWLTDVSEGVDVLLSLVEEKAWQGSVCSMVLHPLYYQMTLSEAPAVDKEEMAEAVRWRLKEFIDYPIDEAAVDYFTLPDDAYRGRKSMLYTAVIRKNSLESLLAPVEATGLVVDCIEVSELALHNLSFALPERVGGVAILHLLENGGFINLVEDGHIYLSRKLDIGYGVFNNVSGFTASADSQQELLLLEIQRSLDFYESQLGKGIVSTLYYSPVAMMPAAVIEFLSTQLGLNIEVFDLSSLLNSDLDYDSLAMSATAVGAAIGPHRQQELIHAAH